jgi:hypothetical protein
MSVNNAAYMPTPRTLKVRVMRDNFTGETVIDPDWVRERDCSLIRVENAVVITRGNLSRNGDCRWFEVRLSTGEELWTIGEGS